MDPTQRRAARKRVRTREYRVNSVLASEVACPGVKTQRAEDPANGGSRGGAKQRRLRPSRRLARPKWIRPNSRRGARSARNGSGLRAGGLALSAPRRMRTATKPARKQRGGSSHRLLDSAPLPLLSQHHSTALPSPKRYEAKR